MSTDDNKNSSDDNWTFKLDETALKEKTKKEKVPSSKKPKPKEHLQIDSSQRPKKVSRSALAREDQRQEEDDSYQQIVAPTFDRRFVAFVIDFFFIGIISLVVISFEASLIKLFTYKYQTMLKANFPALSLACCYIFFHILPSAFLGKSVGKFFFQIQISDSINGTKASFFKVFIREILRVPSLLTGLGVLISFFRKDSRSLHDLLIQTGLHDSSVELDD